MTRGSYTVEGGSHTPSSTKPDSSFRTFIFALLVFAVICLVIFLVMFKWKAIKKDNTDDVAVLAQQGNIISGGKNNQESLNTTHETTTVNNDSVDLINLPSSTQPNDDISLSTSQNGTHENEKYVAAMTIPPENRKNEEKDSKELLIDNIDSTTTTERSIDDHTPPPTPEDNVSPQYENPSSSSTIKAILTTSEDNDTGASETENDDFNETDPSAAMPTTMPPKDQIFSATPDNGILDSSGKTFSAPTTEASTYRSTSANPVKQALDEENDAVTNSTNNGNQTEFAIGHPHVNDGGDEPVCTFPECYVTSSRMLGLMNHGKEPCEDFYGFACGGVHLVREESAESAGVLSTYLNDEVDSAPEEYLRIFKEFKDSCVQYEDSMSFWDRIEIVKESLKDVGDFLFHTTDQVDLTELFAKLIQRQSMPLFEIGLGVDDKTSKIIPELTLPDESTLPMRLTEWSCSLSQHRNHCLKKQKTFHQFLDLNVLYKSYLECCEDYTEYLENLKSVLRALLVSLNKTDTDLMANVISSFVDSTILNSLKKLPAPNEIRYKYIKKEYQVKTVEELDKDYSAFGWSWTKLISSLIGRAYQPDEVVHVYLNEYFKEIFNCSLSFPKNKLNDALLAIYAYDVYLNTLQKSRPDTDKYCLDLSLKLMPNIGSHLSSIVYSKDDREKWSQMLKHKFTSLKNTMEASLEIQTWMTDPDKSILIKQCSDSKLLFYTETNLTDLATSYSNTLVDKKAFPGNLIKFLIKFRKDSWFLVGHPVSDSIIFDRFLSPMSTKPLLIRPNGLVVTIPYGLMERVSEQLPEYLKAARIDFHLAKVIGKIFDPTDIKLTDMTTYEAFIDHNNPSADLVTSRLYNAQNITYNVNRLKVTSVNDEIVENIGFRLLSDNINKGSADQNDQRLPWMSKDNSFLREKQFLITVAQEYCERDDLLEFMLKIFEGNQLPPSLSVENLVKNSAFFKDRFSCKPGSGMVPVFVKEPFPYLVKDEYEYVSNES